MQIERTIVPCGACTLCCRFGVTPVGVEEMALEHYDATVVDVPGQGRMWSLKRDPETGACVYLKDGGCSIWERAPATCRSFDCRREYASRDRATRRREGRELPLWKAIFDAAKSRFALDATREPR